MLQWGPDGFDSDEVLVAAQYLVVSFLLASLLLTIAMEQLPALIMTDEVFKAEGVAVIFEPMESLVFDDPSRTSAFGTARFASTFLDSIMCGSLSKTLWEWSGVFRGLKVVVIITTVVTFGNQYTCGRLINRRKWWNRILEIVWSNIDLIISWVNTEWKYTYIHTHIHIYIHKYIHTYIHTWV